MNYLKHGLLLTSIALTTAAWTCSIDGTEGFLPDNDMYIPANIKSAGGVTEAEFNRVIDKAEAVYSPIIASMNARLEVVRNWNDGTVNAFAQQMGSTWRVSMFGGLARHKTITSDGFALVLCHEIGHHIGGAPRKTSPWGGTAWATNEGQADYFATLKCLRRIWIDEDNASVVAKMEVPAEIKRQCGEQWTWDRDYQICIRGAMAGMSVSKLFQNDRGSEPAVTTPDPAVVTRTNHNHPAFQCRLDTYFQGALCQVDHNQDVSATDEVAGTCHRSIGDTTGVRPFCWFKPSVE